MKRATKFEPVSRRAFHGAMLTVAMAVTAATFGGKANAADAFPTKPLKLIVPFAAGAGADAIARLIGDRLGKALGQAVVVDNKPGANGLLGADAAARSTPDGYTLVLLDRSVLGINPSLYKKLPYDPVKDFSYIGIAAWAPYVMVVNPKVPATNLSELIAYTKQRPGQVDYGSFGKGSLPQIDMEMSKTRLGLMLNEVPYKGAAPAITAAMGGEVSVTLSSIGSLIGAIRDNRLRPIVLGAARRSPLLPDVPTIVEAGGDDDTLLATYFGFALPAGTPPPIASTIGDQMRAVMAMPDVQAQLAALGMEAAPVRGDAMAAIVKDDIARFAKMAASLGIQPE